MNKTTNDPAATGTGESSAAWGTTSFVPGHDVGLIARHTVGLVERNNPSTRERLWGLVSTDAPLDDILDELSSTGLKSLPDFGIAQVDGDSVRVVARGRTVVTAELGSGGTHVVDATTVRTWIEEALSDVVAVTIALAAASDDDVIEVGVGDTFAVLAGSVPATSLTRRYDTPDPHAAAAADWPHTAALADSVDSVAVAVEPEDFETSVADLVEADLSDTDLEFDTGDASADDMEDVGTNIASTPLPSDPSWFEESDLSDSINLDDSRPSDPQPPSPQMADTPPPNAPAPHYDGLVAPPDSTVILAPDDAATRVPTSAPFDVEADLEQSLGDDDEADDDEGLGQSGGADMANTIVGVLSFSNGTRLDVDRSVLIGRNPKVAGAVDGTLPHILKFEGPGQGLSRTHAEIRIESGAMVLEDLQSTNGTEVELPGEPRRRLHGGDPMVIVPGTLIDFGDELHCTVESAW